ncbi:MAG: hypothetical protein ACU837_11310 [Gammaproteobacteria bacterium]
MMPSSRLRLVVLLAVLVASPALSAGQPSRCDQNRGDGSVAFPFCFDEGPKTGSAAWKNTMNLYGDALRRHKVRQILLVHGTFVGDDPFGFYHILENLVDDIGAGEYLNLKRLIDAIKKTGKLNLINLVVGDVGNFTTDYATQYCSTLGSEICNTDDVLVWGSGNYHLARLEGTLKLAQVLAERIHAKRIRADERILLLGHSHAGQVFALLTTLLENGKKAQAILHFVAENENLGEASKQRLLADLAAIRSTALDFVTYGTPVRYSWGRYSRFRLLAIVNHRPRSGPLQFLDPLGLSGVLRVRDGDYVQQWGVEGTDTPLIIDRDSIAGETRLDAILGNPPQNLPALIDALKFNSRRQPYYDGGEPVGTTVFVDYRDNASMPLPDLAAGAYAASKVFGHGIYTTVEAMQFNTGIIVKQWYAR